MRQQPQPQPAAPLPPCPYCGKPCWAPLPEHPDPDMRERIRVALKGRTLLSTCEDGWRNDFNASGGFCYGSILDMIDLFYEEQTVKAATRQAASAATQCGIPAGPAETAVTRVPGGSAAAFRRGEEVWLVIDRDAGKRGSSGK
jgi:hypothetical protein